MDARRHAMRAVAFRYRATDFKSQIACYHLCALVLIRRGSRAAHRKSSIRKNERVRQAQCRAGPMVKLKSPLDSLGSPCYAVALEHLGGARGE